MPLADVQALYNSYLSCLQALSAQGIQSYTIAGRTFTRADLRAITSTLGSLAFAIKFLGGGIVSTTYADMSCGDAYRNY